MTGAPDAGAQQLLCDGARRAYLVRIAPVHHSMQADTVQVLRHEPRMPSAREASRECVAAAVFPAGNPCGHRRGQRYHHAQGDRQPCISMFAQFRTGARYTGGSAPTARIFTIFEGTSEIQRLIIGRAITGLAVR
jgi:hypothetical protein